MRPSSGGSRRILNCLLPSWTRVAISTARPATGTALSEVSTRSAVGWVGATRAEETCRLNGRIGAFEAAAEGAPAAAVGAAAPVRLSPWVGAEVERLVAAIALA